MFVEEIPEAVARKFSSAEKSADGPPFILRRTTLPES
jgi:hypothetical protein